MFQVDDIQNKLYGVVGFRQPFDPTYAILDADNQISRSGYYVNDNAFVKIPQIKQSQDYIDISDADFNEYLKRIQFASISNVCNQVFNRFSYLDRNLLFTNPNNRVNQSVLQDGFVGYRIEVSKDQNIAFEIKRVLLDFDTLGNFKLMLFNTAQSTPIQEQDISVTSKTQQVELNWVVNNSGDTYKGDYYLGYIKTATTPIPYERGYESSDVLTCFKHLYIEEVQVKGHATETLFDLTKEEGLSHDIGVNPDIVVYEDFTDLIMQNERMFARAIQLDMSIAILREYLNSLRSNADQRRGEAQASRILIEIEGQSGVGVLTVTGLRPLLIGEINQISQEIDKLKEGYFNDKIRVSTIV